jgi:hypothetical protein
MKFTALIVLLLAVQFATAQIKVVKLGEKVKLYRPVRRPRLIETGL